MRLFIALEVPDTVKDELASVQQRLNRGNNLPVRWVARIAYHLTLHFLGEVDDMLVPDVVTSLNHAVTSIQDTQADGETWPRLLLHLTRAGAFPNLKRPQTLWVGIDGQVALLTQIHQIVAESLDLPNFAPDTRPFHPHLTLGRVRRDASADAVAEVGNRIGHLDDVPQPVSWLCNPPVLFQSILKPEGPVYRKLS